MPAIIYSNYPFALDTTNELPITSDNVTQVNAEVVNRQRSAIIAIEGELGVDPSGTYTTVRARLDAIEGLIDTILGGGSTIIIKDEGVDIDVNASTINFIGADVQASSASPGVVNVFIPPPDYLSHWNTSDGSNGSQAVTESISRTTARISSPTSEGNPFSTNSWAGTNQAASINATVVNTTPGNTTGFGGDSTIEVIVYAANGTTVLDSYTTPVITGNGVHNSGSGRITVTITSYGADSSRFRANASVSTNIAGIFTDNGDEGGRYHIEITHTTDSVTDGTGSYVYAQTDVFYDANLTTPSIATSVTIAETSGSVVTKHLSGIEYYTLGSDFTVSVNDINQHNRNTSRTSASLLLRGTEYGLPDLDLSPFGTGSGNFIGWTNNYNLNGVDYQQTNWEITATNYRYIGPTGNVTGQPRDPWNSGSQVPSADDEILVDTYGTTSTNTVENFDDEARRQDGHFNSGTTSGNWVSTATLGVDLISGVNEAIVFGGQLMIPNQTTFIRSDGASSANANWSTYVPNLGGANPNYTSLGGPAVYYRSFVDTGASRSSFTMTFTGTFVSNATTDLANENLKITIYKIDGLGNIGAPPGNTTPLFVHGAGYNFGTFDDGVTDGQIRLGSSSGNTVECTFGGFNMEDGVFCEIRIENNSIKISSVTFTFN